VDFIGFYLNSARLSYGTEEYFSSLRWGGDELLCLWAEQNASIELCLPRSLVPQHRIKLGVFFVFCL
jgi:hypothetical protein